MDPTLVISIASIFYYKSNVVTSIYVYFIIFCNRNRTRSGSHLERGGTRSKREVGDAETPYPPPPQKKKQ